MSKPTQLSRRLSAQLMADCIALHQADPFVPDRGIEITLTPDTAAKLIPILTRFVEKAAAERTKPPQVPKPNGKGARK